MSREQVIRCDICGTTKKEANHWWKFWVDSPDDNSPDRLVVADSKDKDAPDDYKDACGPKCLSTALDRWTSNGNFAVPREIKD